VTAYGTFLAFNLIFFCRRISPQKPIKKSNQRGRFVYRRANRWAKRPLGSPVNEEIGQQPTL